LAGLAALVPRDLACAAARPRVLGGRRSRGNGEIRKSAWETTESKSRPCDRCFWRFRGELTRKQGRGGVQLDGARVTASPPGATANWWRVASKRRGCLPRICRVTQVLEISKILFDTPDGLDTIVACYQAIIVYGLDGHGGRSRPGEEVAPVGWRGSIIRKIWR